MQIKDEVRGALEFVDYVYQKFGFKYELELSTVIVVPSFYHTWEFSVSHVMMTCSLQLYYTEWTWSITIHFSRQPCFILFSFTYLVATIKVELRHHLNILTLLLWHVIIVFPCECPEHLSNDAPQSMYSLLHFSFYYVCGICLVSNRFMNVFQVNEMPIDLSSGILSF